MKTIFIAAIVTAIIISSGIGVWAYLDEPKTGSDCRKKYGKVKQDIQDCMDRINNKWFVIPSASGIPFFTEEEKVNIAQTIAIGRITAYEDDGIYRMYDVQVIQYLKNDLGNETLSFRSINEKGFNTRAPKAIFEVGDYGVFSLRDYEKGVLESTYFSEKISKFQIEQEAKRITKIMAKNDFPFLGGPADDLVTNASPTTNDLLVIGIVSGLGAILAIVWRKGK